MARFTTANDVVNRAALESGLVPSPDPFGDPDETFVQLAGLLNSAGQEMVELFPWQILLKDFSFVTTEGDSGTYDLPEDFAYMVDQTGWDRSNENPLGGPLSSQQWAYLQGRNLNENTLYVSFQLAQGKLQLYPQPPPPEVEVAFKYINRNWVVGDDQENTPKDQITDGADIVLYDPILIIKFLKCKFLEAKGFDPTSARMEFENMMNSRTGKDTGAPILNSANSRGGFTYLSWYNIPDTGYGVP